MLILALWRVTSAGEAELAKSTAALTQGDVATAIVHAERAAGWYLPGAPHVRVAYGRLVAIAERAEKHQRPDDALRAWRAIHNAAVETRSMFPHHAELRARADREIARLSLVGKVPLPGQNPSLVLADLATDPGLDPWWTTLVALGLLSWVGGLGWTVFRAVDATGHIAQKRLSIPLGFTLAGAILWVLAMWRA